MADNQQDDQSSTSGGLGGIGDKLSDAAGGGTAGGVQGYISKGKCSASPILFWVLVDTTTVGIETVQQSVFGQGKPSEPEAAGQAQQSHEVAVDQAHPEKISEFLRDKHMSNAE